MNARDKELWVQSQQWDSSDDGRSKLKIFESVEKFADRIRADERDTFIAFIQDYPHWLGDNAKREIISAIRARGNT